MHVLISAKVVMDEQTHVWDAILGMLKRRHLVLLANLLAQHVLIHRIFALLVKVVSVCKITHPEFVCVQK